MKKAKNRDNVHIGMADLSNINDVAKLITSIAKECGYIKRVLIDFESGSITIVEDMEPVKFN